MTKKIVSVILVRQVDDDHPLDESPASWSQLTLRPSRKAETISSESTANPSAALTIEVYTAPGRPIVSASEPGGPGDLPTWSPSSATLIYGNHDAVLVDALATYDQADALADWINTKGRRLSRIYITHGHGDHWLGLARLIQRFPDATGLATAEVFARVEFEAGPSMAGYWEGIFPGAVPTGASKVLPQLLTTDTIDLEGNELRVIKIGQADTAESTVLYIPSLAAVVTGDLAYNEVHMMTAETGAAERAQWIANLDEVAALEPTVVVYTVVALIGLCLGLAFGWQVHHVDWWTGLAGAAGGFGSFGALYWATGLPSTL